MPLSEGDTDIAICDTLKDGLTEKPNANLAVISVPGNMPPTKPAKPWKPGCMFFSSATTFPLKMNWN